MTMASGWLIDRKAVRKAALAIARETRHQPFSQVGASFLSRINAAVFRQIEREVESHPSVGKTLK